MTDAKNEGAGGASHSDAGLGVTSTATTKDRLVFVFGRDMDGNLTWDFISAKAAAVDIIKGQPFY